MLAFLSAILPYLQWLPIIAFLALSWETRCAAWMAIRRRHRLDLHAIIEVPMFFLGLNIAWNVSTITVLGNVVPAPEALSLAGARVFGIACHVIVAVAMIAVVRALRGFDIVAPGQE